MSAPTQIFVTGSGHVHYAPVDNGTEYIRADLHEREIARLKSALEKARILADTDRDLSNAHIEQWCSSHTQARSYILHKIYEALSPSAPAETNSVQTGSKSVITPAGQDNSQKQYYLPPDTRKAGVSALAEGEWREFRPSQSNPIQMGDQYRPKPELAISWQQGWSDIEGWIGMTQASENLIYRRLRPATKEE